MRKVKTDLDLQSQLESLLDQVWRSEADWRLWDRVNAAWVAGHPHSEGAKELAAIWCGLRRQDIFPLSAWAGALGLFGRTNHVISSAGLRSVLEKNLPYERLEDACVPVHVITTDLKNGEAVVLSSGPAVPALLA